MNKPKVKEISETLFEVFSYSVKLQKKKGRTILLCSCSNSSRFSNNNFCYHKHLVLEYISLKPLKERLEKLINDYSGFTNIKSKFGAEIFLNDLNKLKRLIEGKKF